MTFQVLEGDCVELMAAMPAGSVDAVVCDPPYGLEFMGKDWDRLGDIGKVSHSGPSERDGSTVFGRQRVAFNGSSNVRCRSCNKWKWGHKPGDGGGGGLRCQCETPDFPSPRPDQARLMQEWHQAWATEALRVLKPGGHLLAFGGTRTYHRLVCAVEDAGFEIRDTISWLYGSGFPKSLNVGNGFGTALKPAHEPVVVARKPLSGTVAGNVLEHGTGALNVDGCRVGHASEADLAESQAKNPGRDDLVSSDVYGNGRPQQSVNVDGRWPANVVLSHTEGCVQVGTRKVKSGNHGGAPGGFGAAALYGDGDKGLDVSGGYGTETVGAWSCTPDCAVRLLDEQTGEQHARGNASPEQRRASNGTWPTWNEGAVSPPNPGDSGGASRFFYVAKASRAERNAGLEGFGEQRKAQLAGAMKDGELDDVSARYLSQPMSNVHPTVKPISLMRWLCRLVTPPPRTCETCGGCGVFQPLPEKHHDPHTCEECEGEGVVAGRVLDPFAGSGTTGCAAVLEGFDFVGLEREEEYVRIAEARIAWWHKHRGDGEAAEILAAGELRDAVEATGQLGMFD